MKTTLVIQEGKQQIVLTPECEYEKVILKLIEANKVETTLKVGNFSDCQGGWIRYYPLSIGGAFGHDEDKFDSLMIILKGKDSGGTE